MLPSQQTPLLFPRKSGGVGQGGILFPSHLLVEPLVEGEGQVARDKALILLPWRC